MEKILISSCLFGYNTTYNKSNHKLTRLDELKKKYELVPFCNEVMGGLLIPRNPAEIKGNKVIDINGNDVTNNYLYGVSLADKIIRKNNIKIAILKDNSPSCGSNYIYDGSFTHKLIKGEGILAKALKEKGIIIYTEDTYLELLK